MRSFEIMNPKIIKGNMVDLPPFVYHASDIQNEDSILKNGLLRKSKISILPEMNYNNRIYVFKDLILNEIHNYILELFSEKYKHNEVSKFTLFKIKTSNIEDFKFFNDPMSFTAAKALYTECGNIPSSAISIKGRYNLINP